MLGKGRGGVGPGHDVAHGKPAASRTLPEPVTGKDKGDVSPRASGRNGGVREMVYVHHVEVVEVDRPGVTTDRDFVTTLVQPRCQHRLGGRSGRVLDSPPACQRSRRRGRCARAQPTPASTTRPPETGSPKAQRRHAAQAASA